MFFANLLTQSLHCIQAAEMIASPSILLRGQMRQFQLREATSDALVFDRIIAKRQYDLRRLRRVNELGEFVAGAIKATGKHPLVLDLGANIGASSMFFADHIQDALVVALEPDPGNFKVLTENIDPLCVQPMLAAISSSKGYARLVDPGEGHWGYRTEKMTAQANAPGLVPCLTVNDIYAQLHSRCFPFLVKIDIEGSEADLFSRNTEWVARTPLIIVELHDWLLTKGGSSRSFLRCISRHNRDFVSLGEEIYSIANDLGRRSP